MNQYENDLRIDENALDREWILQPVLFSKYSNMLANARKKAARAAENVKTVKAELILRGNTEVEKPTAANVDAWVRIQDEYLEVVTIKIEFEYQVGMLETAVFAFHQRKAALENLVQLWKGDYFSAPKEEKMEQKISDDKSLNQKKRLNRNRSK